MKESNFQFKNPVVEKIEFYPQQLDNESSEAEIEHEMSTEIMKSKNSNDAKVSLSLTIVARNKNEDVIFDMHMMISSYFRWEEVLEEDLINDLLRINGSALLLSYARPIISNLVSLSGYPPYHIPFIDFT